MADLPTYLALVQEGAFDVDARTWAEGRAYVNGSWLAQRLYHAVYGLSGWAGLQCLHLASLGVALGLSAWAAARRGGGLAAALAMGLALLLMTGNTASRPQTLALPLAVVLWLSPSALRCGALAALWANLHGSAVLAPLLALAAGRPKAAAAAGLGLLCTPWGFDWVGYVLLNTGRPAARGLDEWSVPGAAGAYAARLALGLGGMLALAWWARSQATRAEAPERAPRGSAGPSLGEGLLLLALSGLAATAIRHVLWIGLIGGAVAGGWLAWRPSSGWRPATLTLLGAVGLSLALLVGGVAGVQDRAAQPFGDQAPRFLVQGEAPEGLDTLNAPFELAGLARLRWGVRTPVDVRLWLYTDAEWARYLAERIEPSANPVLLCEAREPALAAATRGWTELRREGCWVLRAPVDTNSP